MIVALIRLFVDYPLPEDYRLLISIPTKQQISGHQLTLIEEESYLFGTFLHYVIPINDTTALVLGTDAADADFAERFLETLEIN